MKISKEELQEIILEELKREMLEEGELEEGLGRKLRSLFGMQSEKDFEDEAEDIAVGEAAGVEEDFNAATDALMDAKNALLKLAQLDAEAVGDSDIKSKLAAFSTAVKGMYEELKRIARGRKPAREPNEEEFRKGQARAQRTRAKNLQRNAMAAGVVPNVQENKKRKRR